MKQRISVKLILAVAAVLVPTIAVFSYFLARSQQRALISQIEHSANQISETIKSGTMHDMLHNRRDRLHQTIDTFGRQQGIEQVRIFNKDGEIIYSSDRSVTGSMVDKRAEACYACHAADRPLAALDIPERTRIFTAPGGFRNLGIINPVYNATDCSQASCHAHDPTQKVLGVLDVTMSLEEVDRQLARNWVRVSLFALAALFISSLIIWVVVQRLVGRPVGQLVRATEAVAGGDFGCTVDVRRRDELGNLASSFNEMTRKLGEAQQQLYQSDKLASLGRLAAGVAHEINNPLTGVLTYASFLLKRSKDPETKNDLETIVHETKRCRQIVKGLLDFSRQVRPKMKLVDIQDVIARSLRIVRNRLNFDGIVVKTVYAGGLPAVVADPSQLAQVFINLVMNAADAIGEAGGEISITAEPREVDGNPLVEIRVIDNGCGIPGDEIGKVFEPFYSTKGQEGTGLGRAVVWGIVAKHDGTIDLKSDPGRGTTVTLRLPVRSQSGLAMRQTA